MPTKLVALACLCLASTSGVAMAQAQPAVADIGALFKELDGNRPGCAIGATRDGKLIHASAHGAFSLDTGRPLATDTVFNIGSISKQFTAFAVLLLAEQGKLSLDDSIRRHVKELGSYADRVTLRHLLHHVGGLRDYIGLLRFEGHDYDIRTTPEQALDVLSRQLAANAAPGTEYEYSNTGYFLLGVVVERVSGQSLAEFSRRHIFDPLGMRDTRIVERYPAGIERLAAGYEQTAARYVVDKSIWEQTGDGQVHTTVADLALWADNFRSGKVGARVLDRMQSNYTLTSGTVIKYFAGLVPGRYRGLATLSHGGDWAGFHSYLLMFPAQRFSTSVLCSWTQAEPDNYAYQIADRYLADDFRSESKEGPSETVVALLAAESRSTPSQLPLGWYANVNHTGYVQLYRHGGRLSLELDEETLPLEEVEPKVYRVGNSDSNCYAIFQPAAGGEPARIVVQSSPQPATYQAVQPWKPNLARYVGSFDGLEVRVKFSLDVKAGRLVLGVGTREYPLQPMATNEFAGTGLPDEGQPFTLRFNANSKEVTYFSEGLRGLRVARAIP